MGVVSVQAIGRVVAVGTLAVGGCDVRVAAVSRGNKIKVRTELTVVGAKVEISAGPNREGRRVAAGVGDAAAQDGHAVVEVDFRAIHDEMEYVEPNEFTFEIRRFALRPGPEPENAFV